MLRARVWRDRNNRYVCDLCRRKLSPGIASISCRQSTHDDASARTALVLRLAPGTGSRTFATTRTAWKPGPSPPAGGFGGFGGFANKEVGSRNELLPHERAAKAAQKTAPQSQAEVRELPEQEPQARQNGLDAHKTEPNQGAQRQRNGQQMQNGQRGPVQDTRRRQGRQPDPAKQARHQDATAKSRETLQSLFDKARSRPQNAQQPQITPLSHSSSSSHSTVQNPPQRTESPGGWGAFSSRQSSVQAPPPRPPHPPAKPATPTLEQGTSHSARSTAQSSWGAFGGRQSSVQSTQRATGSSPASSARPSAADTSAAPPKEKQPITPVAPAGDDFWDAIENQKPKSKRKEGPRRAAVPSRKVESVKAHPVKLADNDFWDEVAAKGRPQGRAQSQYVATEEPKEAEVPAPKLDSAPSTGGEFWDEFDTRGGRQKERRSRDRGHERVPDRVEDRPQKWTRRSEKKYIQNKQQRESRYDEDDMDAALARQERQQAKKQRKREQREVEAVEEDDTLVPIFLPEYVSVMSLADSLGQKMKQFLVDLEDFGFENMTSDTLMTGETAALIAMEYGFDPTVDDGSKRDLRPRPPPEDITALPPRPPIVTIMGHVDHGKTTLLDYLRKSSVAAQEHGGITQHIGAFVVKMSSGKPITFLDTPGHAAFLTMRQRGANVTDIVVLVVAADDSVKPQTLEALKHAQTAQVPIIVAINKIDKEEARVGQVKADLARHGVEIEDYGGDVQVVCVSGKTGKGMDDLEENINTLSEILDTRAESDGMAEGWVLESSVKQDGKVATVLVKRGTLRVGDHILAGRSHARVRVLRNEAGAEVQEAAPGTPVEILGWRELPDAGDQVLQASDEAAIKRAVQYREEMADNHQSSIYIAQQEQKQREKAEREAAEAAAKAFAEEMGEEYEEKPDDGPKIIYQNFVIKADVAGSVEAVVASVQEQGNNEVQSKVLRSGAGQITEYDVDHAATSNSIIVNFNNSIQPNIRLRADQAGVRIIDHSVIYHLTDEVRSSLSDLLPVAVSHKNLGEADILQVFPINVKGRKYRNIAGCRIRNGSIKKTSLVKILRWGKVIYEGKIETLKHVKKDVMEMAKGSECGIGFEDFQDFQVDDQIQAYEIVEEKRHL